MLQLAVICPGDALAGQLFRILPQVPQVEFIAVLRTYPSPKELLDLLRGRRAQALLLSADDLQAASQLAASVDRNLPGFPIVTVSETRDEGILATLMQAGVRDHLSAPLEAEDLIQALHAAKRRSQPSTPAAGSGIRTALVTFLPARAGVGATTVATAVSASLACQFQMRTLLMDCDLSAGVVQFLLKANRGSSLPDALEHSSTIDAPSWHQVVGRWRDLELLHAGTLDERKALNLEGLDNLLDIARERYDIICADLPSAIDGLSEMMLRDSSRIFLVTTSEIVSLHMASVRLRQLTERGLRSRVQLVLNRKMPRGKVRDQDIEQAVGLPIAFSLSNDYASVQTAILEASPLAMKGDLAKGMTELARSMAVVPMRKEEAPRRRFLEFFTMQTPETDWSR